MGFSKKIKTNYKNSQPVNIPYKIIKTYQNPDPCFIQGLYYDGDYLYISCGLYGKSRISLNQLGVDSLIKNTNYLLGNNVFSEGITKIDDKLYSLTWKQQVGSVFLVTQDNLKLVQKFSYQGEGWGLTHNYKDQLIMSNGTDTLTYLDTQNFQTLKLLQVYDQNGPVINLNALAYYKGFIFANVWYRDKIIVISELDGQVKGEIDLKLICQLDTEGVLNGLTFIGDNLLVTGKNWKTMYLISLGFFLNLK